jgi:zinc protease
MANNILGVFGLGGRIGEQVREKHGMAYYAATSLDGGLGPGAWYAYAGVNPANVEKAADAIVREIQKFTARGVTAQELADNKAFFVGRLPLSLETNSGVANSISTMELHNLGLDYLQRYPAMMQAITRDEVLEVTREFLDPERYAVAIAGPEPKQN